MDEPKVLLGGRKVPAEPVLVPDSGGGSWQLIAALGWLFVVVGGTDALLVWYPFRFGNPDWEFGSITASLNGLPLPVMGLAMVLAAALARRQYLLVRVVGVLLGILALVVLLMGVMYATNVPIGLRSVTEPVARQGLKKAIVKTVVQLLFYPAGLAWLVMISWKRTRRVKK